MGECMDNFNNQEMNNGMNNFGQNNGYEQNSGLAQGAYSFNNPNYQVYKKPKNNIIGKVGAMLQWGMYIVTFLLVCFIGAILVLDGEDFESLFYELVGINILALAIEIIPSIIFGILEIIGLTKKVSAFVVFSLVIDIMCIFGGFGALIIIIFS